MRLVTLDIGEKRIGVATADSSVKIAIPYTTIAVDGNEFAAIAKIMEHESAQHLVIGLPRNSQGLETAQSRYVRRFVDQLQDYFSREHLKVPLIKFQDESLTSVQAEQRLLAHASKRHPIQKGDIDREAAAIILQDFLDSFSQTASDKTLDLNSALSATERPDTKTKETKHAKKKSQKSKHSIIFKFFAVILALLIVFAVIAIAWYYDAISPLDPGNCQSGSDCQTIEFIVQEGETTSQIADHLEQSKIIKSALAFKINLFIEHRNFTLKSGTYTLNSGMSLSRVIQLMQDGGAAQTFTVTFIPGERLTEVKQRLLALGFLEADIDAAFQQEYSQPIFADKPAGTSLEGYIYGDTYEFYSDATVSDILNRVFDQLQSVADENQLVAKYSAQGLNFYEGLTLASIVQREAYAADMPQVAQVFYSRLARNMALGSDVVIAYGADQINPNRDPSDLSYLDTLSCPWNSRLCTGLPPQPVSNPGLAALLAVANPASGDYLYFLTGDDGTMHYAYTYEEHKANQSAYCRELCGIL